MPTRSVSSPVPAEPRPIPSGLKILGALCLLVALAASFVLALDHFDLARPPGCGLQSGCERATRGPWGTVRVGNFQWPVSLLGVAAMGAMLAAWLTCRRGIHPLLRTIVWLGAAVSVMFIMVMLGHGYVCKYCLATHAGNLGFLIVMEVAARRRGRGVSFAPIAFAVLVFIAITAALAVINIQTSARRRARDEAELQKSIAQIEQRNTAATRGATGKPFTGRYHLGPADAPIRIVMFMDYQCIDCKALETEIMGLLQRRQDVSLSVKHFPFCADCNLYVGGSRMHPNACWAARAAEAAGMLRGNDGFWQMHNWLFSQGGAFTDANFPPSLQALGYDSREFIQTMSSQQTIDLVKADVNEAHDLGLYFTPLVFINGVELRGFINNPGALTRAVEQVAAQHPLPGTAAQDHPPLAAQKYVDDWATGTSINIPPAAHGWALGPADARVQIVVWGDYQEPYTAELDAAIRQQIAAGRSARYTFRHYPFDQSCNSTVPQTAHPWACVASRAAEAAGALGGNDAYWKMHAFLFAHVTGFNGETLAQGAAAAGLEPAALSAKMNDPQVLSAVTSDAQLGQSLIMQGSIPTLYINGRWVPRWKIDEHSLLEAIIRQTGG